MNRKRFNRKGIYSKQFKGGSQSKRLSTHNIVTSKKLKVNNLRDKILVQNSTEEEPNARPVDAMSKELFENQIKKSRIRRVQNQRNKMEKNASFTNMSMAARANNSSKNGSSWKYRNRMGSLSRDHRKVKLRSRNRTGLAISKMHTLDPELNPSHMEKTEISIYTRKESRKKDNTPGKPKRRKSKSGDKCRKANTSKSMRKKMLKGRNGRDKKKSKKKIKRDFTGDRKLKGLLRNKKSSGPRPPSNVMRTMGAGETYDKKKEGSTRKNHSALYEIGYKMTGTAKKDSERWLMPRVYNNNSTKANPDSHRISSGGDSRRSKRSTKLETTRPADHDKANDPKYLTTSAASIYNDPEVDGETNRTLYGQIGYTYDEVNERVIQHDEKIVTDRNHGETIYKSGLEAANQDAKGPINMGIRYPKLGNPRFFTETAEPSRPHGGQETTNIYNKGKKTQHREPISSNKSENHRNISQEQVRRDSDHKPKHEQRKSTPLNIPERTDEEKTKMLYSRRESNHPSESREPSSGQNRKLRDKLKQKKQAFPRKTRTGRSLALKGRRPKKLNQRRIQRPALDNKKRGKKRKQESSNSKYDYAKKRAELTREKSFKGQSLKKHNPTTNLTKILFEKNEGRNFSKNRKPTNTNLYDHKHKNSFGKNAQSKSSRKNQSKSNKIHLGKRSESKSLLRKNIFKTKQKAARGGVEISERKPDSKADPGTEVSEGGENSLACKEQIVFGADNSHGSGPLPGVRAHMTREIIETQENQGIYEADQNMAKYTKSEDLENKKINIGVELLRSDLFDMGANKGINGGELGSIGEIGKFAEGKQSQNKKMKISSSEAGSGLRHFGGRAISNARSGDLRTQK